MRVRDARVWILAGLAGLFAGCTAKSVTTAAASAAAAPVRVAEATVRSVPVELSAVGSVEAYSTISVRAQVTGTLTAVHFKEGDAVRQGQLLFELDSRPFEQAVKQCEANLARDQALLDQAKASLARDQAQRRYYETQANRYEELQRQGIFSKEQADQARTEALARVSAVRADEAALASLAATLNADQATLEKARVDLSYCGISSPLDGRTGSIAVKQGNLVKASDMEMVTIRQIQPVYVSFTVPERNVQEVRARMGPQKLPVEAKVKGGAGPVEQGSLSFIENTVDEKTGTLRLKATFRNESAQLWPGQFVDVRVRLREQPNTVVVPAKALQTGQAGNFVYVLKGDNTVEMRNVETGPRLGDLTAMQSGVSAGERVVTEGQLRLSPGARAKVLP